jgi:Cys-tRNA(Pro)/Cys-tRNA(Cys) deacylase
MISNNVTRLLDNHKVVYTVFELPVEKLGAEETAEFLGIPLEQIFKTIVVVRPQGKPILCVLAGDMRVDLKAVAKLVDEKKVSIPTQVEAEKLTGLQTGGISPLALINKGFVTIIDDAALNFESVHVSGGQRGLNLRIPVDALKTFCNATTAPISLPKS